MSLYLDLFDNVNCILCIILNDIINMWYEWVKFIVYDVLIMYFTIFMYIFLNWYLICYDELFNDICLSSNVNKKIDSQNIFIKIPLTTFTYLNQFVCIFNRIPNIFWVIKRINDHVLYVNKNTKTKFLCKLIFQFFPNLFWVYMISIKKGIL